MQEANPQAHPPAFSLGLPRCLGCGGPIAYHHDVVCLADVLFAHAWCIPRGRISAHA